MNEKNKVIEYLLSKKRDENNKFKISSEKYDLKGISQEEFIRYLDILEKEGLIHVSAPGSKTTPDLRHWREIELLPPILSYKKNESEKYFQKFKDINSIVISWLALILSIASIIISICK